METLCEHFGEDHQLSGGKFTRQQQQGETRQTVQ